MLKKIFPMVLVVLFAATSIFAAAKTTKVTGNLEKITAKTITVKDASSSETKEFAVTHDTQFLVNNKSSRSVTLKAGDKVTVEVKNDVAVKVNVEQS